MHSVKMRDFAYKSGLIPIIPLFKNKFIFYIFLWFFCIFFLIVAFLLHFFGIFSGCRRFLRQFFDDALLYFGDAVGLRFVICLFQRISKTRGIGAAVAFNHDTAQP